MNSKMKNIMYKRLFGCPASDVRGGADGAKKSAHVKTRVGVGLLIVELAALGRTGEMRPAAFNYISCFEKALARVVCTA